MTHDSPRTQLSKCIAELMTGEMRWRKLSRRERISCTKDLRNMMEGRRSRLLQVELEHSLDDTVRYLYYVVFILNIIATFSREKRGGDK